MVLLMPALAYAMTTFVIVPKLQKGLGGPPPPPPLPLRFRRIHRQVEKGQRCAKKESVPMNKLLVNVNGASGRFLLGQPFSRWFRRGFQGPDGVARRATPRYRPGHARTKTLADLEKPTSRNLIRNEFISGFNNILGDGSVEEIYFPEFAIQ